MGATSLVVYRKDYDDEMGEGESACMKSGYTACIDLSSCLKVLSGQWIHLSTSREGRMDRVKWSFEAVDREQRNGWGQLTDNKVTSSVYKYGACVVAIFVNFINAFNAMVTAYSRCLHFISFTCNKHHRLLMST